MVKNNEQQVKTLSEQVRWQLLWLSSGLFIACLLLLTAFFWRVTELNVNSLIQLDAQSVIWEMNNNPDYILPKDKSFSVYRQWNSIPEAIQQKFSDMPNGNGITADAIITDDSGELVYIYLSRYVDEKHGKLYMISQHPAVDIEAMSTSFLKTAVNQSLWITIIIFIFIFLLVAWLIRRTTQPLTLLSQWALSQGKNPSQTLTTNFPIEELNQIAAQLQEGVVRVQAFNQREQQFLKHASHELRTPLAIIQASLDTLNLQDNETNHPAIQRALKASANMRRLSAALLWLARESEKPIDKSSVDVETTCNQNIDDLRYLLLDRDVSIETQFTADTLFIENDLFQIIIANLIRNALQYSANGIIKITVSSDGLCISNPVDNESNYKTDMVAPGFGLGLQLVQRICKKLNWDFNYKNDQSGVVVTVNWLV